MPASWRVWSMMDCHWSRSASGRFVLKRLSESRAPIGFPLSSPPISRIPRILRGEGVSMGSRSRQGLSGTGISHVRLRWAGCVAGSRPGHSGAGRVGLVRHIEPRHGAGEWTRYSRDGYQRDRADRRIRGAAILYCPIDLPHARADQGRPPRALTELKQAARVVLASLRRSTYNTRYDSRLRLPRPRDDLFEYPARKFVRRRTSPILSPLVADTIRINKFFTQHGICSRREADD